MFYVLEPVFEKASTVYMPVDNDKVVMRRIMNRDEAEELIDNITEIETVWVKEEKGREQMYKDAIRTYDCQSLVQIIKTLYMRRQSRIKEGKKVLSSDEQYLRKAEALLYSEMSVALNIPKEEVQEYISDAVKRKKNLVWSICSVIKESQTAGSGFFGEKCALWYTIKRLAFLRIKLYACIVHANDSYPVCRRAVINVGHIDV